MSTVVTSFATGFLRTTIVQDDDGTYRWIRRPGTDRGGEIPVPHPRLRAAITSVPAGRVALTLPEPAQNDGVTYRTGRYTTVAFLFLGMAGATPGLEQTAGDTLAEAGATLARLHSAPLPEADLPAPPDGVRRLLAWLDAGRGPRGAARLHRRAVEVLGRARLEKAREWCAIGGDRRVLLHGAPGSGILLPIGAGHDGALLIGEDLSAGPPEFDLGWLTGELVEFSHVGRIPGSPFPHVDHDALIHRLLDAYPAPLDRAATGRVAALRFLTHTHDFAAYVGWHESLEQHLPALAVTIDAAADGHLLP
ncbi:phosphotransferase [Herbidospora mongoliensis]|uniref:phosphotransferase n=1 Tax=Herbidospora mongoliensis TaxID=688067 RepID=UPI00082D4F89|nr:phosphotransferase [Herbidospora mongoliensis]